jgi:hypothetical protein
VSCRERQAGHDAGDGKPIEPLSSPTLRAGNDLPALGVYGSAMDATARLQRRNP